MRERLQINRFLPLRHFFRVFLLLRVSINFIITHRISCDGNRNGMPRAPINHRTTYSQRRKWQRRKNWKLLLVVASLGTGWGNGTEVARMRPQWWGCSMFIVHLLLECWMRHRIHSISSRWRCKRTTNYDSFFASFFFKNSMRGMSPPNLLGTSRISRRIGMCDI